VDQNSEEKYVPLNRLSEDQAPFYIYNSLLSEYGAMGFEVGYSMSAPQSLTIWEAQFGDFVNGAQIVIDQFLSSAATKWQRMNGTVLYLPHGYEGMGPEHSSARMERFLDLCAQNNMYIVNLTSPANLFHALRRQVNLPFRRPLVVFSPKSLLRHPECVSSVNDFLEGNSFQPVIDDPQVKATQVKRVVLCTGKLYFELKKYRDKFEKYDVALVRVEQIYPLDKEQIRKLVKQRYKKSTSVVWAQEEPGNMGAWRFMLDQFRGEIDLEPVTRKNSSSPATGSRSQHDRQQAYLIKKSLDLSPDVQLEG
jgi:2-oxoglutarate dehydrogenase E1 component